MSNEKKISIEKVISDIKESNGNGKRKGCHGLHQCLSDDGYIRQIVCWTRITSPDRIDALVEHADKQNAEITALRTALTALTSQLESVVSENAALNDKMDKLATWPGIEFYSSSWEFNSGDGNEALEFMCDVQTPATDAFLAEVRASGVEMFSASQKVVGPHEHPYSVVANEFAAKIREGVQS